MLAASADLFYFLELTKTLNVSRAAERLAITQPTLTQSLKRLEQQLDTQLFIRSKTGLTLTRAGEKLVPRVQALMNDWEALKAELSDEEKDLKGHFRMGCHAAVASYTLGSIYQHFSKHSPMIELSHRFDLSRNITELIVTYQLDFGLVINPYPHPDLVIKKILTDEVLIWESKNRKTDLLFADISLTQTQTLLKKLKSKGFHFSKVVPISDLFVIESLIAHGEGYGILPARVISPNQKKSFVSVNSDVYKFEDELALVYRKEMMRSHTAQYILKEIPKLFH
jgi:LysR family transcriptional regulator, cell division regulator